MMGSSVLTGLCVTAIYGLLITLALLINPRGNRRSSLYLSLLELLMALSIVSHSLFYSGITRRYPHLYLITGFDGFLYGPLFYFHIGALTDPGGDWTLPRFLKRHCILVYALLIYQIPFFMQSALEKVAVMDRRFLVYPGDQLVISLLQNVQFLIYIGASLGLILTFKKLKNGDDFIYQGIRKWLNAILVYASVTVLLATVKTAYSNAFGNWLLPVIFGGFFTLTAYFWFFYPEVFVSVMKSRVKYQKSGLTDEHSERFEARLIALMESEQLYLNANLSLTDLSDRLKVSQVYTSQIINERFQCSFFDFINGYRIQLAQEKLNNLDKGRTILDVAYEVGFNSKSTFYSAFKKKTQMTPGEYLKEKASLR